jgi:CHASE2 domain-containing sensor protein
MTDTLRVFISYRRDDSIVHARLIYAELSQRLGTDAVFMDIEDIPYGGDFKQAIDARLSDCAVVIAVIGPRWSEQLRRRAGADDYVHHELARALSLGKRLLPVLVGRATPPAAADVPADLQGLCRLNQLTLDDRSLKPHLNALLEAVQGRSFEQVLIDLQIALRQARRARWVGAATGLAAFCAAWMALFDALALDTRAATWTMVLASAATDAAPDAPNPVVLAAIDERTVAAIGRPFGPSWRREHARFIERAARAGARSLAFDIQFDKPADPADDHALASAIATARGAMPVALAASAFDGTTLTVPPALRAGITPAQNAGVIPALACVGEKLGRAQSMLLFLQRGETLLPSLALAAFSGGGAIEAHDGARRMLRVRLVHEQQSPDIGYSALERPRGPQDRCPGVAAGDQVGVQWFDPLLLALPQRQPQRVAYEDVLSGRAADALRGRIVLVGTELPGQDTVQPAVQTAGAPRWGVQLIAAQIDAIANGPVIRPLGAAATFALMIAIGVAGATTRHLLAARHIAWRAAALPAGLVLLAAAAAAVYHRTHLLVALPYGIAAFVAAWFIVARLDRGRM